MKIEVAVAIVTYPIVVFAVHWIFEIDYFLSMAVVIPFEMFARLWLASVVYVIKEIKYKLRDRKREEIKL